MSSVSSSTFSVLPAAFSRGTKAVSNSTSSGTRTAERHRSQATSISALIAPRSRTSSPLRLAERGGGDARRRRGVSVRGAVARLVRVQRARGVERALGVQTLAEPKVYESEKVEGRAVVRVEVNGLRQVSEGHPVAPKIVVDEAEKV